MKPLVSLCPLVVTGQQHVGVSLFMAWAAAWQASHPEEILDLQIVPEKYTPAPVARNRIIKKARARGVDYAFMLDEDTAAPPEFFAAAVQFLKEHAGPAVIGVPYCTAPPSEEVLAFEWVNGESHTQDVRWKLERIRREDAARRSGIERVANLGTGCVCFDLRVFDKITHPYFRYGYTDETETEVNETEDCWCFRRLALAGVPLYVHWDHWAVHWKPKGVQKPVAIGQKDVDAFYVREAEANLRMQAKKAAETAGEGVQPDGLKETVLAGENGQCHPV